MSLYTPWRCALLPVERSRHTVLPTLSPSAPILPLLQRLTPPQTIPTKRLPLPERYSRHLCLLRFLGRARSRDQSHARGPVIVHRDIIERNGQRKGSATQGPALIINDIGFRKSEVLQRCRCLLSPGRDRAGLLGS